MKTTSTKIVNRQGLHARPAAQLVETAGKFKSEVWLERDGLRINAKSIMGVMMLAAEQGCELTIITEGEDEDSALDAIKAVIDSGFGELEKK